jgi:hypothetical protein
MSRCMLSILIEREGQAVAFYHGRNVAYNHGLRQIKDYGLSYGGSFHHSKVRSLRKNQNVETIAQGAGWTAFEFKHGKDV